jgi:Zn finger protein HypA/HybF involved in hydrogenase expression
MIIENAAVKLDGEVVEPRHKIEIFCPQCNRDVDEAELAAQKCGDCGKILSEPTQNVAISVTSQPLGGKTMGQ